MYFDRFVFLVSVLLFCCCCGNACVLFQQPLLEYEGALYWVDACFNQTPRPCNNSLAADSYCQYMGFKYAEYYQQILAGSLSCLGATYVGNVTNSYAPICIKSEACCGGFAAIYCC